MTKTEGYLIGRTMREWYVYKKDTEKLLHLKNTGGTYSSTDLLFAERGLLERELMLTKLGVMVHKPKPKQHHVSAYLKLKRGIIDDLRS